MTKTIKTLGLLIFLTGFGIFIYSFFIQSYRLDSSVISQVITDSNQAAAIDEATKEIHGQTIGNFAFIDAIEKAISRANNGLLATKGLGESEYDKLLEAHSSASDGVFKLDMLDAILDESPTAASQKEYFSQYAGWMDGRNFTSDDFSSNLKQQFTNINDGIVRAEGFDRYKTKSLKYEIAKASSIGPVKDNQGLFLFLTYVLCIVGALMYILPKLKELPGIKNNGIMHSALKNTGWLGIGLGMFLIAFYVFLYYFPEYMTSWIITVDPVSMFLKNSPAGQFFLYGFIYTLCILVMGVRMIINYRHNKYQMVRTASVMFFQTAFAFLIPEILLRLNQPYFDFKNIWPLDYDFFFDNELNNLLSSGGIGLFMLFWGIMLFIVGVPVMVYFLGKRWYCSWVCGCGGLAETLGDPFRHLSDKRLSAWKVERWTIHAVLVFAVVMTAGVLYTFFTGESQILGMSSYKIRETYGAWIGAGFAGVIGTGFYPLMGNRMWCRFGCPLAAYLGIIQRFKSKFRITTNGAQCISCGNCSTSCEMGIDVRWYAQRGQNIVRSSCVGCGVCSAVCPRGVLNLENKDEDGRFGMPILIGNDSFEVKSN